MNTAIEQVPQRRGRRRILPTPRSLTRVGVAVVATALGIGGLAAPAYAATAVFDVGGESGAAASIGDYAFAGASIHLDGTNWTTGSGTGSCIAVKLGNGSGAGGPAGAVGTTQLAPPAATGACAGKNAADFGAWALIPAADDGSLAADIPFPTSSNSTGPAIVDADWASGTKHHFRLLTGAVNGGTIRSAYLDFTVAAAATTPTITPPTVTVSGSTVYASLTGSGFTGGETLTADLDGTALTFGTGAGTPSTTVPASGTFSGVRLNLPSGTRAGQYTVTIHRSTPGAQDYALPLKVNPTVAWSGGARAGASGTLTLGNLVNGAAIASVTLGDRVVASDLTADGTGVATAPYAIPSTFVPGQYPLVTVQTGPTAVTYTVNATVYPDETPFGTSRFTVLSDPNSLPTSPAGLYQSAYSAHEHALYVTAANQGQGTSGFLYKLDPDTLAVITSVNMTTITKDADGNDVSGIGGGFGVGVDDVHGTVWVTLTGRNYSTVAVYRASDLALIKQLPTGTISHPRDVVYDPKSDLVFASSASEGTSGNGYISVFRSTAPYDKITDIQTGPRTDFNPVSLSLDNGTLVSPSLQSNKVVKIDTAHATDVGYQPTFLQVGTYLGSGRGASGIAYEAADNRLFIASQNQNAVTIADATTGDVIKTVPTGQQTLNVAYDSVHKLAYVTNFGGTSVTVLDADGNKIAALPITRANHVFVDEQGVAFVVDKNATPTNRVWRITPRLETVNGVDVLTPTAGSATGNPATTPLKVTVTYGGALHIEGTNFLTQTGTSGSTIAVKLDGLGAEPAGGKVVNPNTGLPVGGVYGIASADDTGNWSLDLPFPKAANVSDPAQAWGLGSTHYLRLLTGSLKPGDTIRSIAIAVTVNPAALTAPTPTITGTAKVGQTLTARPGTWTSGAALTYQWKRSGATIAGATKSTYKVTAADANKKLTVTVTGSLPGYTTVSKSSAAVTVAPGTLTASTPKISGTAKVGKTLTAKPGTWTAGTKLTYQWKRSGATIAGATKSTYKVTAADAKKKVTVTVTGSLPGYTTVSKSSAAITVAPGTLTAPTPTIIGTAKAGSTLSARVGTWTAGTKLTYRWYAAGKALAGKTGKTVKLSSSQVGKTITVKVTGSKAGYLTVTKTSRPTAKVKK